MKLLLCGCRGRMGRAVAAIAAEQPDVTVVAGVDPAGGEAAFPVLTHPAECTSAVDVVVDFSDPAALEEELAYVRERRLPLVLATTGLSQEQIALVDAAAQEVPVFFSSNMSFGVALLAALTEKAAAVLGDGYDIEILEMHHNQKLDAPSGTAKMLAQAAEKGLAFTPDIVYDRHERRQKRDPREIGIASLRGGTVVGQHEVIFAGRDEVLRLSHEAQSRDIFAVGALRAARFLLDKPAGLYTMRDLMDQ